MTSEPALILLTHRRGALFVLCDKDTELTLCNLDFLENIVCQEEFYREDTPFGPVEYFSFSGLLFTRVLGKTAENLFSLFQWTCQKAKTPLAQMKTFYVGVGPGSFTGLRLGCAFINGILLGQPRQAFGLATDLLPDLRAQFSPATSQNGLERALGPTSPQDDSSGFVTFHDALLAIKRIKAGHSIQMDPLLPQYGKDPTPVQKLKEGIIP